jgi:hypothetical protein
MLYGRFDSNVNCDLNSKQMMPGIAAQWGGPCELPDHADMDDVLDIPMPFLQLCPGIVDSALRYCRFQAWSCSTLLAALPPNSIEPEFRPGKRRFRLDAGFGTFGQMLFIIVCQVLLDFHARNAKLTGVAIPFTVCHFPLPNLV